MFKNSGTTVSFPAGAIIFSRGDDSGGLMYVVVDGDVEIRLHDQVIDTIGRGATLGEVGLVDKGPRSATAIAKTDCRLEPVDARRFEFLVQQTPFFALDVMRALVDRLRRQREH